MTELWRYRDTANPQPPTDVVGFDVVATDGSIGKVDQATYDAGASYLVVDTGPWIFGKKRMLPAGAIDRIDYDRRQVLVKLTKDQIRTRPTTRPPATRTRSTAAASAPTTDASGPEPHSPRPGRWHPWRPPYLGGAMVFRARSAARSSRASA
jgi:hypothetical protein